MHFMKLCKGSLTVQFAMTPLITMLAPEKSWEWTGVFELVPADYQSRGGTYSYPVVVLAAGETKGGKAVTQVRADILYCTVLYCTVLYCHPGQGR